MLTFKHSGALGDLLYCLPVMRALGGGELLLDIGPTTCFWTGLYADVLGAVRRLFLAQNYIHNLRVWRPGEPVSYDLNRWRTGFCGPYHPRVLAIPHMALMAFGLPLSELAVPWLAVDPVWLPGKDIVINRTARYHSRFFRWSDLLSDRRDRSVFVGLPAEHADFCREFGEVDYWPTEDLYEVARLISGCQLYLGNQSSSYVIAEALHKRLVLEVCPLAPNGLTFRAGATYHMVY